MKAKNLLAVLSASIVIAGTSVVCTAINANAETQVEDLKDEYVWNSYLEIPNKKLTLNNVDKDAQIIVTSPSGISYRSNKLYLDEIGYWTVTYSAKFGNTPTEENHSFYVYKNTYHTTKSSITFGKNETYFPNSDEGINIRLTKGDTFEYGEIIDLTKCDKKALISVGLAPLSKGTSDVSSLTVRLTDAFDDNNYIDYIFTDPNASDAGQYVGFGTICASFSGQSIRMGLESASETKGENWHVSDRTYGAYTRFSFDGMITDTKYPANTDAITTLAYDVTNKHVLAFDKVWGGGLNTRYQDVAQLVADLSRSEYKADNISNVKLNPLGSHGFTEPFKGFKTNQVKLSIFADGYAGNECGIFVTKLFGADYTQEKSYDNLNPLLDVDLLGFEENELPNAKVGVPYKLFNCNSFDDYTIKSNLTTNVYFSKDGFKLRSIPINNGYFTPEEVGEYTIEFTAIDGSNRTVTKYVTVKALASIDKPTIALDGEIVGSAFCGSTVTIPGVTVESFTGNPESNYVVTKDDKVVETQNDELFISEPGNYVVTFTVKDYIGQETKLEKTIVATADPNPVVVNEPVLPPALIYGYEYNFNEITAYDYNSMSKGQPRAIKSSISIREGSSVTNLKKANNFGFKVASTTTDNVTINYTFASGTGSKVFSTTIPVIQIENKDFKGETPLKLILTNDDVTKSIDKNNTLIEFNNDTTVKFANAVATEGTEFIFNFDQSTANVASGINFYLRDTLDSSKIIKVSFTSKGKNETTSLVSVNNGDPVECKGNFAGIGDSSLEFILNQSTKSITVGATKVEFDTYLNGNKFEGFNSARAYFDFETVGVSKKCKLNILRIGSQTIASSSRGDKTEPIVVVDGVAKHTYEIGEEIETFLGYGCDTYQPETTKSLSLIYPNNENVTLLDGTLAKNLDPNKTYKFKFNSYGTIYADYTVVDAIGNESIKRVTYKCLDQVAPVINGNVKSCVVRANKNIDFGKFTFSDDATPKANIQFMVYFIDPEAITSLYKSGIGNSVSVSYTFKKVGKWEMYVVAYDESGNPAYASMNIYVK